MCIKNYSPWPNAVDKPNGAAVVIVPNGLAPNDVPNPPNEGAIGIILNNKYQYVIVVSGCIKI